MLFHVMNKIKGEINLCLCVSFILNVLFCFFKKWIPCLVLISFHRHMKIKFSFYVHCEVTSSSHCNKIICDVF